LILYVAPILELVIFIANLVVTAAVGMDQVNYDETINHVVYAVLDSKNENLIQFF